MNIQITSVNMRYGEGALTGVQVHHNSHSADRTLNVNGLVALTVEEYQGNEELSVLNGIVKQKIIDRLVNGEPGNRRTLNKTFIE